VLRARWFQRGVAGVIMAACLFFVGRALVRSWDEAGDAIAGASAPLLAAAFAAATVGMIVIAVLWHRILVEMNRRPRLADTVRWYFVGELGKYVPGGIWPLVGRAELARRSGIDPTTAYASTVVSLACLVAACGIGGGIVTLFTGDHALIGLALGAGGLAIVVGLHPHWRRLLGARFDKLRRFDEAADIPSPRSTAITVAAYGLAWVAIAASSVLVARAVADDVDTVSVVAATLAAWAAGFAVVPVPGGLGVRESVFIALADLPEGQAVTIAIVARAIMILVDVAGGAIAALTAPTLRTMVSEARR
jgi:uncharacterized membrane protein YbhN (UPF0104 family)